jgi:hypothetical protein
MVTHCRHSSCSRQLQQSTKIISAITKKNIKLSPLHREQNDLYHRASKLFFFGQVPQWLLWANSWNTHVKITIRGIPDGLKECVIFYGMFIFYQNGHRPHKKTWWVANWTPMICMQQKLSDFHNNFEPEGDNLFDSQPLL